MMPTLKAQIHWLARVQFSIVAAVVLMVLLFYQCAYQPQAGRLQALNERIGQNQLEASAAQSRAQALPALEADVDHLRIGVAEFKKLSARPQDIGHFQADLKELAEESHLRGWTMSWQGTPARDGRISDGKNPDAKSLAGELFTVPIRLQFTGSFDDCYFFLSHLRNLPRLTRVRTMDVKDSTDEAAVDVQMTLNLYYSQAS